MFRLTTDSIPVEVAEGGETFTLHMTPMSSQEVADGRKRGEPPEDPDARAQYMADLFPVALESCRAHVTGWDGVGDEQGEAVAFSPDTLESLLADPHRIWSIYFAWLRACNEAARGNSEP